MKKKLKYILGFGLLALFLSACSKDDEGGDTGDSLESSSWVAVLTDGNPSTNPAGGVGINGSNQYYPWKECHMDDTFSFSKDRLTINGNGTACEAGEDLMFETKNQPYSYNSEKKKLTVGTGDDVVVLDVYELNKDRLKLGLSVVAPGGGSNIIFLFKRK